MKICLKDQKMTGEDHQSLELNHMVDLSMDKILEEGSLDNRDKCLRVRTFQHSINQIKIS
jgi:hypothetical protein